jgi:hypothetical protein
MGVLACSDPVTGPETIPPPTFAIVDAAIAGDGLPFVGAVVLGGSSCSVGKRGEMKANLYWQVPDGPRVQSLLLWLERADGSQRQVSRKVLGSPRSSGVAAGFEYQEHGRWVVARLELYAGAPDYTAPRTTIRVPCS